MDVVRTYMYRSTYSKLRCIRSDYSVTILTTNGSNKESTSVCIHTGIPYRRTHVHTYMMYLLYVHAHTYVRTAYVHVHVTDIASLLDRRNHLPGESVTHSLGRFIRQNQRVLVVVVLDGTAGATRQQQANDARLLSEHGDMERRLPVVVLGVDWTALLDQISGHRLVASEAIEPAKKQDGRLPPPFIDMTPLPRLSAAKCSAVIP
mmetsp:Transcript_9904/g.28537  ORF Transcript_9904/g.28537 Transcript_9904/m.28537 type:complete len:205 (-) Transcript_9904:866-1480(-)